MGVDATAIARVIGITTEFQDLREGVAARLPQHVAVFAQGATASSFSTAKWQLTTALAAGQKYGFDSQIYHIAKALRPAGGGGLGTVPVTIFPLDDHASGTAAAGDITPSGTTTEAGTYYARIGGVLSQAFTIAKGAINVSVVCRALREAIAAIAEMPVTAGYTYDTITEDHTGNTGDGTLTELSASTTTCMPGDWVLECTAAATDGGTFKLTDPDGTEVADDIALPGTPSGYIVFDEGGLTGKVTDGTNDFIVGDKFTITVPVTKVDAVLAWKGASGNATVIEIIDALGDLTWTITQPTGGATNPSLSAAIALMGETWYTMAIIALDVDDTTALDALKTEGEARWGALVAKPFVAFVGNTDATTDDATAVSATRTSDKINCQLNAPDSPTLPCVVCAAQVARIAREANNDPAMDYVGPVTGIIAGDDDKQWNHTSCDLALKAGCSTIEVHDTEVWVSDVVTFYAPEGDDLPAYRWVCDIVKLQNCIYNTELIFNSTDWRGHPIVADDQPTTNPNARKPFMAKADIAEMLVGLGKAAILADVATAKKTILASVNGANSRRLDTEVTYAIASNVGIVSHTQKFGFYFGA